MEFIPAKRRFSTHASSLNVDRRILEESVKHFGRSSQRATFRRLPGGFMNANFLASVDAERFVVRAYSTDATTADRECDLLSSLAATDVRVPTVLARFDIEGCAVALVEFIDGVTLEDRLQMEPAPPLSVYRDIGAQLARIHCITFPETGFLGPQLRIGREYDDLGSFVASYIERVLAMLADRPDRLDRDVNRRLLHLVRERWELVMRTEPRRQLVHCDFNPKNLLVSADASASVMAVIDWEFCLSGNGLGDLGNFFRFEYDYPAGAREMFIDGYQSNNPTLPSDWYDASKLIDIGNMCSFLERREDYQESFHTARTVIASTLEHFGY